VQIKFNGDEIEVPDILSINNLILSQNLPKYGIMINLNGLLLEPALWEITRLNPGDNVETFFFFPSGG
jgi:sulfur carrier protein ThiS